MTSSAPRPLPLHNSGVTYIHFPPYSRAEAVYLITQGDAPLPTDAKSIIVDDSKRVYVQFAVTVYDSLVATTASTSLNTFQNLCEKLWPRFVWPAISGESPPGKPKAAMWDFARLLIRNRSLFQAVGEATLMERLQTDSVAWTFEQLQKESEAHAHEKDSVSASTSVAPTTPTKRPLSSSETKVSSATAPTPLLKHFPTILLLSAYLASHTLVKNDIILFSRLSSSTKRIRKRGPRKSLFKSPSKTPAKASATSDGESNPGTPSAGAGNDEEHARPHPHTLRPQVWSAEGFQP